jgi:BirA family biotin operon repressor/biotin-[acetyl-CoA-carboxylase] ligase
MLLDLSRLRSALQNAPVGHTVDYHLSVPSTMPLAHALAGQPGGASGLIVVAEEQTAGRGRFARRWESPAGQALLFSVVLRAPLAFDPAELAIRSGLAVALALEQAEPTLCGRVGLKWPNDLLLGESPASAGKVGGILIESTWQGQQLDHCVVGIGLNVNQGADELPSGPADAPAPVSLRTCLGRREPLDRTALLVLLCRSLGEQLTGAGESSLIFQAWRQRLWTLGQAVNVFEGGVQVWQGRAITVEADGSLVVESASGEARRFVAGEVTVRSAGQAISV